MDRYKYKLCWNNNYEYPEIRTVKGDRCSAPISLVDMKDICKSVEVMFYFALVCPTADFPELTAIDAREALNILKKSPNYC